MSGKGVIKMMIAPFWASKELEKRVILAFFG